MHKNKYQQHTDKNLFFKTSTTVDQQTHKKHKNVDLSQTPLKIKLNLYLKKVGRKNDDGSDYQLSKGYCHGLTLLFLEKMSEGKVPWFYNTKRKIIECDDNTLEEMELEIEKFFSLMEWAQNPGKYTQESIGYSNIDKILDTKPQISFDNLYTFDQLKHFLTYKRNKGNMICITNCYGESKEHSVGIFSDGINYHFYDANYKNGRAISFKSSKELAKEVLNRLYTNFEEEIPSQAQLEIKIVNCTTRKKTFKVTPQAIQSAPLEFQKSLKF